MATVFPRMSVLKPDHFRTVRFSERIAELCSELENSKALVQSQCLSAVVLITTVIYILTRTIDSVWAVPFILPIIAIGSASLQHALTLYGHYVRASAMPALCEGIGRLRHTVGDAPDLCFHSLVRAGMLPRHGQRLIDDVVYGDYRGHRLTLAMVDLWHGPGDVPLDHASGDAFRGVVAAIHWPTAPISLPADNLSRLIDGRDRARLTWQDDHVMVVIPCVATPFALGRLFDSSQRFSAELQRVADVIQIPHRLIDHLLDQTSGHAVEGQGATHTSINE